MSANLTLHAKQQIASRAVTTESEVLAAVNRHENAIRSSRAHEVRVVVKVLTASVYLPDGSNGDVVLACVDPSTVRVKTVMVQRRSQAIRKSREVPYLR